MKAMRGYYSLVQYCPDASRAEAANVGVLLFCPDAAFIEARTAKGNDRIRRFFKDRDFDRRQINAAKAAIEQRLVVDRASFRTLEDLQRFIDTRGNEIILTPPRPVKVFDPSRDLDQLFGELVGGRARRAKDAGPVLPALDRILRRPSLQGRIHFDEQVVVPIVKRTLHVPYSYRNGEVNYVQPEVFAADHGLVTRRAERLALEGNLLQKNPVDGTSRRLVVVASFEQGPDAQALANMTGDLFDAYSVRMVRADQIEAFGQEVEKQAH